jgi:uncharacterized Tic20 family protein
MMNTNEMKLESRTWAAGCHMIAILGLALPLGNLIGPFLVWILKKNECEEVNIEGKEALNFQLTASLLILPLSLLGTGWMEIPLGFTAIYFIKYSAWFVAIGLSAIKGYKIYHGETFEYPVNFRLLK